MNFFQAQNDLVGRLKEKVPLVKEVFTSNSVATLVTNTPKITPCIYLIYDGYFLDQKMSASELKTQMVHQRWIVMVVTRNQSLGLLQGGADSKDMAGDVLTQVIEAVLGWKPPTSSRVFRLADGSKPMYSEEGVDYTPLTFVIPTTITGAG